MFYKYERLTSAMRRGRRLRAGARSPWFHEMIPFKAYYSPTSGSYFEMHLYPDAQRALLVGYCRDGKFFHIDGQMELSPQQVGYANWEDFLKRWADCPSYPKKQAG
jgi:hypothetical protein